MEDDSCHLQSTRPLRACTHLARPGSPRAHAEHIRPFKDDAGVRRKASSRRLPCTRRRRLARVYASKSPASIASAVSFAASRACTHPARAGSSRTYPPFQR